MGATFNGELFRLQALGEFPDGNRHLCVALQRPGQLCVEPATELLVNDALHVHGIRTGRESRQDGASFRLVLGGVVCIRGSRRSWETVAVHKMPETNGAPEATRTPDRRLRRPLLRSFAVISAHIDFTF
jgi:hypothetical protein